MFRKDSTGRSENIWGRMGLSLHTIKRLSTYRSALKNISETGKKCILSSELAEIVGVKACQVRKDFSYFGPLGKKKVGYDIDLVVERLNKVFGGDQISNVVVVGVGHIGRALIAYQGLFWERIRIVAGFDLKSRPPINETPIYAAKTLDGFLVRNQDITVAVLCESSRNAQGVANRLVKLGIKGILNFAPVRLTVPRDVSVIHINIGADLESLFFLTRLKNGSAEEPRPGRGKQDMLA